MLKKQQFINITLMLSKKKKSENRNIKATFELTRHEVLPK
jgi:hypothetical protein